MIEDKLPTFRSAVRAMIDGLRNHEDLNLTIEMHSYGYQYNGRCFGCSATATLLQAELATQESPSSDIGTELFSFEACINDFRLGNTEPLLHFYDETCKSPASWCMSTTNWEQELPFVERWLDEHFPEET